MQPRTDDLSLLPLTEPTFLILLSLFIEPRHGYSIMKDVQALSHDRVLLSTGTLYGALKRLLDMNLIERFDKVDPKKNGRKKIVYTLTDLGRQTLKAEHSRLNELIIAAANRLSQQDAQNNQASALSS